MKTSQDYETELHTSGHTAGAKIRLRATPICYYVCSLFVCAQQSLLLCCATSMSTEAKNTEYPQSATKFINKTTNDELEYFTMVAFATALERSYSSKMLKRKHFAANLQ